MPICLGSLSTSTSDFWGLLLLDINGVLANFCGYTSRSLFHAGSLAGITLRGSTAGVYSCALESIAGVTDSPKRAIGFATDRFLSNIAFL